MIVVAVMGLNADANPVEYGRITYDRGKLSQSLLRPDGKNAMEYTWEEPVMVDGVRSRDETPVAWIGRCRSSTTQ